MFRVLLMAFHSFCYHGLSQWLSAKSNSKRRRIYSANVPVEQCVDWKKRETLCHMYAFWKKTQISYFNDHFFFATHLDQLEIFEEYSTQIIQEQCRHKWSLNKQWLSLYGTTKPLTTRTSQIQKPFYSRR